MVLVSGDQVTDHVFMMFLGLYPVFFIKGADLLSVKVCAAAEIQVYAYSRGLVMDNGWYGSCWPPAISSGTYPWYS